MEVSIELILGGIGAITGALSLVISFHFNKKAIEQTDRNLKTQLIYEDKKRALFSLQKVVEEGDYSKEKIYIFLNSFEGNFIPQEVRKEVLIGLGKLNEFDNKHSPYPKPDEPSEEELKQLGVWDPQEGMNEYEKFEDDFENEVNSFKYSTKNSISEALKKI